MSISPPRQESLMPFAATAEQKSAIVVLGLQGHSARSIVGITGYPHALVHAVLDAAACPPPGVRPDTTARDCADLYTEGISVQAIARHFRITPETVRHHLSSTITTTTEHPVESAKEEDPPCPGEPC